MQYTLLYVKSYVCLQMNLTCMTDGCETTFPKSKYHLPNILGLIRCEIIFMTISSTTNILFKVCNTVFILVKIRLDFTFE